ncbi:unnamed protein product [Adineta steineri]|uniref:RRM domain-containing protein n=1 Tax=Adineta steineri TaxID=433720 RepID=A0A818SKG5_9BILA|nr:unnamed protein product [Adineta steineri]
MNGREVRRNHSGNYNNYGSQNRNEPKRNRMIPNEPPYTAYIGNTPDTMVQGDFEKQLFTGLKVKQVRLVRDRQTDRFRGFAYVEFEDADSLRSAIALDGMFVNDRPIRIDVASRPLGAPKSEGFRNKPNFESRNGPRQPSGNKNNNNNNNNYQTNDRFRQDGNQRGTGQITENSHYRNGNNHGYHNQVNSDNDNEQKSQSQNKRITSQISDDVFITPDTAVSNEDDNDEHLNSKEDSTTITRQQSRNWADCPIDESVIETSSSTNNNTTSKPRDERDPKIAELNKHIEEVVEKDINGLSIKSTTSNEPTNNIIKPIRILSARTESSTTH